ncbi:MAG: PilN domain-containing protein [Burkholderiales bacterium]|nr:PilN domain-containing protein [Burkholderiales bacterium]
MSAKAFTAVALPADVVLERTLVLPPLGAAAHSSALELAVQESSPFPLAETVWAWGYTANSKTSCKVVIASRTAIDGALTAAAPHLSPQSTPEVWFVDDSHQQFVFAGWGEAKRTRRQTAYARWAWSLGVLALLASLALAVVPTAQLRLRAIDAFHRFQDLAQRTQPLVQQRELLNKLSDQEHAIDAMFAERGNALRLMWLLTNTLPDDTHVQTLDMQGLKVKLSGVTANAATLTKALGARAEIKNLRAPTPATRLGPNQEQFTLEFALDAATMSLRPVTQPAAGTSADAPQPETKP